MPRNTRVSGTLEFPPSHNFSPLPPEILKLSMFIILAIYMLMNVSMYHQTCVWKFVPDCVRSNLRGCGGGGCPQTPLVGTCDYYHPAIILFPPNSKSCMKLLGSGPETTIIIIINLCLLYPLTRSNSHKFSFFVSVVPLWNSLPSPVVNASSLNSFKYCLKNSFFS